MDFLNKFKNFVVSLTTEQFVIITVLALLLCFPAGVVFAMYGIFVRDENSKNKSDDDSEK